MICVQVDKTDQLILLGCDNKKYLIYDHDFNVLYDRKFGKKISFVTKCDDKLIIGDYFGDVSVLNYRSAECVGPSESPEDTGRDDKVVVPYSHYSTITASLICRDALFTGDKDGKIIFTSMTNLHEIGSILLAHKICMDIVDNKFLVSISIENTIRIWCLSTFSELLCINLPTDVYNVSCEYSKNLIVVPYCNHLLVTQFNFDKLELRDYFVFKLPFVAQSSLFIDGHLYLIDEFSSLYSVEFDAELGVKDDKDSRKGTIQQLGRVPSSQFSTNIAVELPPLTASKALEPRLLHDDQNRNRGVKINITKHVNV
ncbi:uncharacterized protein TOT_020001099 [Theileria orientalis strain Shintoku]|uniref:Uncharacterized protein n=1 Tax=Theileria orientalis strain Shintoku TaxID=869250 RepID=J4DPG3_THEOR|nr:uncharacterized protein TOT_020001099 [Theileria orientalis strain Shintoku]BAM40654.1 uncharacterized protein TOT_020001099 [Theileria orientalis strain Shintoku]|eukprot:XP_009690955.1 uncharacterized protein TOT_020001099 [Theileria orientalis strain Shintoku]